MAKHKKDPMPNLYAHDKMSFHMLSVCGHCELKDLRSIEGMTKTRANTYIKKGYVERNKDDKTGKSLYSLTAEGRAFVKSEYGFTPYSAKSWRHDSGMRDEFRKIPDECKASIKTEDEYKAELKEWIKHEKASGDRDRWSRANDIEDRWNRGKLSCPDFTYVNQEGQTVYVEVITDYPKSVIQAKMDMAKEFGATFHGVKR